MAVGHGEEAEVLAQVRRGRSRDEVLTVLVAVLVATVLLSVVRYRPPAAPGASSRAFLGLYYIENWSLGLD